MVSQHHYILNSEGLWYMFTLVSPIAKSHHNSPLPTPIFKLGWEEVWEEG